jgi:hypothetical protein
MLLPRIKDTRIGSLQRHDFQAPFIAILHSFAITPPSERQNITRADCTHVAFVIVPVSIKHTENRAWRVDINIPDFGPEAHTESSEVEFEITTDSVAGDSWLYMGRLMAPIIDSETIVARHVGVRNKGPKYIWHDRIVTGDSKHVFTGSASPTSDVFTRLTPITQHNSGWSLLNRDAMLLVSWVTKGSFCLAFRVLNTYVSAIGVIKPLMDRVPFSKVGFFHLG